MCYSRRDKGRRKHVCEPIEVEIPKTGTSSEQYFGGGTSDGFKRSVAEASWTRQFFLEVMESNYDLENALVQSPKIPIIAVTDNKPLYDHIHGDHNVCQDKRLAIEILLLRRDIEKYGVCLRWIDTKQMLVDSTTKTKVKPSLMRHVIKEGAYVIMEEQSMLDAKRELRIQKQKAVVAEDV